MLPRLARTSISMHRTRRRLRCWFVPLLLSAVASLHLVRVYSCDQSAWGAGCGFGMFSKLDYHGSRIQRCRVETNRGTFYVHLNEEFPELDFQAKVLPSDRNLMRLAQAVASKSWTSPVDRPDDSGLLVTNAALPDSTANDSSLVQSATCSDDDVLKLHTIHLEQWRVRFNSQEHRIESWLAKSVELQVETGAKEGDR